MPHPGLPLPLSTPQEYLSLIFDSHTNLSTATGLSTWTIAAIIFLTVVSIYLFTLVVVAVVDCYKKRPGVRGTNYEALDEDWDCAV